MGDLNSHSNACWGSKQTDARGKAWELFICDKGLRVLNRGDKFTFVAPTGQSIVDVAMATPGVADLAKHWAVVDYVPSTDHVLSEFMLLSDNCWTHRPPGYNLNKCDWTTFHDRMEEKPSLVSGPFWTLEDLNMEGSAIQGDAHLCMKQSAPPSATITKIYSIDWWSSKIDSLKKLPYWTALFCNVLHFRG